MYIQYEEKMRDSILQSVYNFAEIEIENKKKFIPGQSYIYPAEPTLHPNDVATLTEAVLNMWYTERNFSNKFKMQLGKVTGCNHVELCNSGSSANLVAVKSCLDLYKSDKKYIATTALAFPTTISAIYLNGKLPLYIDINPNTFEPDFNDMYETSLRGDVAGFILTHTLGFPFSPISVPHNDKWFIADTCDCLGGEFLGKSVHNFCDVSTHSFFPSHGICTGEGGAITTNDDELSTFVFKNINWGRSCTCKPGQSNVCGKRFEWKERGRLPKGWDHKYIFDGVGYNLKMTDLQAALGYSQILRLDSFINKRRNNFSYLADIIKEYNSIHTVTVIDGSNPVPFGFPIIVSYDAKFKTKEFIAFLESNKIGTRRMFGGNMMYQPGYMNLPYSYVNSMAGTDALMEQCFWISVSPSLSFEQLEYMGNKIMEFMSRYE